MPSAGGKKRNFLVFTTICIIICYTNVKNFGVIVILQAKTCKFCSNSQIAGSNFG